MTLAYPKRLIEVDLPIKRISAHARREKSIRHGHISTLHIWWARRPLAACRAVICAALWPDPADELCPPAFREAAAKEILAFARKAMTTKSLADGCSPESMGRWNAYARADYQLDLANPDHLNNLRYALFDFIADFANWDNATNPHFLAASRALTQAAHEALGGLPGTRPLVVDPFAGGGAIPLEALRVGADAFASDLNPVAVLLNKVVLEYIPKYGKAELRMKNAEGEDVVFQGLAEAVRYWGNWIKVQAEKELAEFYPKDPDGATPIAYLWARTIRCEGPGCGAEVPLMRSLWLAKTRHKEVMLRVVPKHESRKVDFEITMNPKPPIRDESTIKNGVALCPCCGYTTTNERVRAQLNEKHGGAGDARLVAVVVKPSDRPGREYRLPISSDLLGLKTASDSYEAIKGSFCSSGLSVVPAEPITTARPSPNARGLSAVTTIGITSFGELFSSRQAFWLTYLVDRVKAIDNQASSLAVATLLALAVGRQADQQSSLVTWIPSIEAVSHTFPRQALQIAWDFVEPNPLADSGGNWIGAVEWIARVCESGGLAKMHGGTAEQMSATSHSLPSDVAAALITDPPYYDSVPYADLSDFFYVWLRRCLRDREPELFSGALSPKDDEAIWNPSRLHQKTGRPKDIEFYETQMQLAMSEGRRIVQASGVGTVVFAHKSTAGWEAILAAMISAGWVVTASWPIDTERGNRVNALETASLASSVHLVCRPRENPDGSVRTSDIGDWRGVLQELPTRIHAWLPRLAREGIVGADAIFACLGPALEIFSRYSRVEKASGEVMTLGQYLEYVWAAVSKEALDGVFQGADTSGFEEDARLTAMWLWTLSADPAQPSEASEPSEGSKPVAGSGGTGYSLEYDAARKIAQGLGAHLERLGHLVQVKGSDARLLPVRERSKYLFGVEGVPAPSLRLREPQPTLFSQLAPADAEAAGWQMPAEVAAPPGATVLDRVHQSMLLFAAGRSDALKRFLQEGGVGGDDRFWRLAQALSALYPAASDEKRWVDGVLARKKGLGF